MTLSKPSIFKPRKSRILGKTKLIKRSKNNFSLAEESDEIWFAIYGMISLDKEGKLYLFQTWYKEVSSISYF